jgi:ribosomal protein L32
MTNEHLTPQSLCPYCGYHPDRASNLSGFHAPEVDDFSVCFNCGEVSRFGKTMRLAKTTRNELVENLDVRHLATIEMMQDVIKKRGPLPLKERKN